MPKPNSGFSFVMRKAMLQVVMRLWALSSTSLLRIDMNRSWTSLPAVPTIMTNARAYRTAR